MVDPITIMAGAQVLGTLAQLYQSEKARGAQKRDLEEIENIFEELKPPNYDISILESPAYIKMAIPEPAFDMSRVTPESFEFLETYVPDVATYVATKNPELVQGTELAKEGQDAQRDALRSLMEVADGKDDVFQSKLNQGMRRAQSEAGSREKSILQGAQRRGALTSGLTAAAQMQSGASAMDRAAGAGVDAATESYRQALGAMAQSGALGGQIQEGEYRKEKGNADIINRFNEMTSSSYQNYLQDKAETLNKAKLKNIDSEQNISNMNVQQQNESAIYNKERDDRLALEQHKRLTAQKEAQNQILEKEASFKQSEQSRVAGLQSQAYQDALSKASGVAGAYTGSSNAAMGAAQDKNKAVQGIADAGTNFLMYKQAQKNSDRDYELRKRRLENDKFLEPVG